MAVKNLSVQPTDIQTLGAKCQGVGFKFFISHQCMEENRNVCLPKFLTKRGLFPMSTLHTTKNGVYHCQ